MNQDTVSENFERILRALEDLCDLKPVPSRTGEVIRRDDPSARVEFETQESGFSMWCWLRTDRWSAGLTVHGTGHESRARDLQQKLESVDEVVRSNNLSAGWMDIRDSSTIVFHAERWTDSARTELSDEDVNLLAELIYDIHSDIA